jgi:replicative DNA helicase
MIREKIDASRERNILINAITSDQFLKAIYPLCRLELLITPYARTIYSWISTYYTEYERAPKGDIQDIYIVHRMDILDSEEQDIISAFLTSISKEYENTTNNIDYIIQQSIEYLQIRAFTLLREKITECIAQKDVNGAEQALVTFKQVSPVKVDNTAIFEQLDTAVNAFTDETETLFSFDGAFGKVVGEFKRTDFVAFLAFAKRGKSFALWETAKRAMIWGNNVLFITLEMPRAQMLRRIWTSLTGKPRQTKLVRKSFFVEAEESTKEDPEFTVDYEEEVIEAIEPTKEFFEQWRKDFRKYFRYGDIRLAAMPAKTATVQDITNCIDNLQYYNDWVPDVVVIDYADLLTSKLKGEVRHQLDDIWSNLRRVALQRNICVITASQSGRASANSDATEETIAEDIRKIAHVTKMIAINATKEEKANGLLRIAQLAERDDESVYGQCYVTSCFSIGAFCMDSKMRREVRIDKSVKDD